MLKTLLLTALASFVVFYVIGLLSRWWSRTTAYCDHDWQRLPASNNWRCLKCRMTQSFPPSESPELEICNLGHVHTLVTPQWQWPDTICEVSEAECIAEMGEAMTRVSRALLQYVLIILIGFAGVVLLSLSFGKRWQLGIIAMVLFIIQGVLIGHSWWYRNAAGTQGKGEQ